MFDDVYNELPTHLQRQKDEMKQHILQYRERYHLDSFKPVEWWITTASATVYSLNFLRLEYLYLFSGVIQSGVLMQPCWIAYSF